MVIIGGLLGICLVLGALGSIVAAVGKPNRPSPTTKKPTPVADTGSQVVHPSPAVGVNPVRVTAAQLLHAYQDNSVSADATYRGARLLVDGSISWVDRDFLGHVVLHLRAGENFDSVMATVNEADTKKAAFLKKGERVVLLCTGKTRMGSAALEDCRL
jgi:hypothetical protein